MTCLLLVITVVMSNNLLSNRWVQDNEKRFSWIWETISVPSHCAWMR